MSVLFSVGIVGVDLGRDLSDQVSKLEDTEYEIGDEIRRYVGGKRRSYAPDS
jgi:hypothetical protein